MSRAQVILVGTQRVLPDEMTPGDCAGALDDAFPDAVVETYADQEAALAAVDQSLDCVFTGQSFDDGALEFLGQLQVEAGDVSVVHLADTPTESIPAAAFDRGLTECRCFETTAEATAALKRTASGILGTNSRQGTDSRTNQYSYRQLIEAIPDPVYVLDDEGYIELVNETLLEKLGFERESLVGAHITEVMPAADVERGSEIVKHLLRSGNADSETLKIELFHADGTSREYEDHLSVIWGSNGEFRGTIGIARDVTEREEREQELEGYETIVETMPDGVFVLDEDTNIVSGNSQAADLLGIAHDELIGTNVQQLIADGLVDESLADQYLDVLPELLSSRTDKEVATLEFTVTPAGTDEERVLQNHMALRPYDEEFRGAIGLVRDITERKERQRELEQHEMIVETMADGVVVTDETDTVVGCNQRTAELFGMPQDELIGSKVPELIDEGIVGAELAEQAAEILPALFSEETDKDEGRFEFPIDPPDSDETRIIRDRLVLRPYDEEYRGTIGVLRDVTDRKERERELEQYETIVETVPDGVFVLDDEGTIVSGNERGAEMLGFEKSGLLGESVSDLIARDIFEERIEDAYSDIVSDLLSEESDRQTGSFEYTVRPAGSDEERIFEARIVLRPTDEEFRGTVGIIRDVTERKQRLRELERYETLVQTVPEPLWATDEQGYFVFANEAGVERFGFDHDRLESGEIHFAEAVGNEHLEKFTEANRKLLSDDYDLGGKAVIEHVAETKDGGLFPAETHYALMPPTEEGVAGTGIVRDITERKQRKERLEVLNRVLRHNLRNELTVVTTTGEMLAERLRTEYDDAEGATLAEEATRSARNLVSMSNEIRRIQAALERDRTDVSEVDAIEMVTGVADALRREHPGATIDLDLPDEAALEADGALEVAVEQLVENAIVHNNGQTRVRISVEDYDAERGEWYELRVADNGPGISRQEQVVFDEDADVTPLQHGSGIGLWAVAWIVQSFDGDIEIETDHSGTTFYIRLRSAL